MEEKFLGMLIVAVATALGLLAIAYNVLMVKPERLRSLPEEAGYQRTAAIISAWE